MRVSQIAAWCECETYALQSPPRQAGRTNIAAHVGTMAHAMIADLPVPEPEGRLAFDYLTPTERAATIQATAIARYARQLMVNQGYGVLAREEEYITEELTGHLDIRAWHSEHGEAIIDLKTGNGIGAAFLQVGGYISLSRPPGINQQVPMGGVLHVPRVRIDKDVKGTLEFRDGMALMQAWTQNYDRIQEVLQGFPPTRSPGLHCKRCAVRDCAVRIG